MKAKMIFHIKEENERITAQKIMLKIFTMWSISLFLILGHFSIGSADDQIITTAVGRGIGDNGRALEAILRRPLSIAFYNGDLFIADSSHNRVRKVNLSTGIITTVAGSGEPCFTITPTNTCGDGGPASEARLTPNRIAMDEAGNLYILVSVFPTSYIRKVDASGIITKFAGGGPPCASTDPCGDGGPAEFATFGFGNMVVKDGKLYIADSSNNRVRKIDLATGIITTVAGTGELCPFNSSDCGDGGLASEARLRNLNGIALDDSGSIYISQQSPHIIRKIDSSTEVINYYAGSTTSCNPTDPCGDGGPAELASFSGIQDLVVNDGDLYVADRGHNKIRKIDLETRNVTNAVGTGNVCSPTMGPCGEGGLAVNANLNEANFLAHDAEGHLYLSDARDHRVKKIDKTSQIITSVAGMIGKGDGGQAIDARLDSPDGIFVDCAGKLLLVESDVNNGNRIREIDMFTGIISTLAGTGHLGFTPDGALAVDARLARPVAVTCNSTGTAVYFTETNDAAHRVRKIDLATGILSTVAGTAGFGGFNGDGILATTARLGSSPSGVIERDGNLYIADTGNSRIRRVDRDGFIWTVVGTGIRGSTGDGGSATAARISGPRGMRFDSLGNLYIAFPGDQSVRMVTPGPPEADGVIDGDVDEIITRVAGTYSTPGFQGDGGSALLARLRSPSTPVLDPDGNLYFTQSGNHIVSRIDLSGIISTVAGMGTIFGFFGDGGPATSALLRGPTGMVMDAAGNIYVGDLNNHRVRRLNEAAAYCDIDPDTINLASGGKWATMYYEPVAPHTSDQIVKSLIYAVDVNGDRISDVLESEPGSPMSTTADSNGNGVPELMRKFNRARIQALVDEPQTVRIVIEVLFDDGRYGACSHVIRVVEPPVHEPNPSSVASEPVEEETAF